MTHRSFDPALLETFLSVLDTGRVSAAAKALHLSQPAITAQIRKLEQSLGAQLFVRQPQGMSPTDAGRTLAGHARAIRKLLEQAALGVAGERESTGPLVIAASTTVAAHVLPPLLSQFRAQYPDIELVVQVGNTEQVVAAVRKERAPLGMVEGHARASGVRLEPFRDDEIVPIMGRHAPFVVRRTSDLDSVPLLWRESGSGTRAVVERALAKAGLGRRRARHLDLVLGSTEVILGGAEAGLGVGFVSRASARAHLAAGLVRIVPALDLVVRRAFRWALPSGTLSGTAARFYEMANAAPTV